MKRLNRISSIILILLNTSCSLKYIETVNSEDKVPEFVFEDTKMVRYENNKPTLEVTAGTLEQYKNSNETYGKDISFTSYDEEWEAWEKDPSAYDKMIEKFSNLDWDNVDYDNWAKAWGYEGDLDEFE